MGGMVYSGDKYEVITPKRDARNIIQFLQQIVTANKEIYQAKAFDFEESLPDLFGKLHHIITHDFLVFVISDFHRYNESVIENLAQLALHNDVVAIKVYDKLEQQMPPEKMVVSNQTHQVNIDGIEQKTGNRFKFRF